MALSDIVTRTRSILYGTGLGEKPAIRIAATDAAEAVAGQLITFVLLAGEGAECAPGQVLSVYDPATEADAHAVYITSISTDTITGINGYLGSPVVVGSNSGDLDSALLEHEPLATQFEIFEAIDTVFSAYLYPSVYNITDATISSPDLVDGQHEVPATVKRITAAYQVIGPTIHKIGHTRNPEDVHTTLSSTGLLAQFDWIDGGTGYYTYHAKLVEADEATQELTQLIATGAAAITLGGHLVETTIQGTKAHNAQAVGQRQQVGGLLWRDFLTIRQGLSEELTRQGTSNIISIDRG